MHNIYFFFWLAKCFQRTRSKKLLKCMSKAHWSILKCITYNWYCLCIVKAAFTFISSKLDLFRSLVPNFTCLVGALAIFLETWAVLCAPWRTPAQQCKWAIMSEKVLPCEWIWDASLCLKNVVALLSFTVYIWLFKPYAVTSKILQKTLKNHS